MLTSRTVPLNLDGQFRHTSMAKTPGRTVSKSRTENLIHHGTIPRNALSKPGSIFATPAPTGPLLDKTPFANRKRNPTASHTPLPFSKLSFLEPKSQEDTPEVALLQPETLLRPSSTRKHIRVPRSASKSFETPQNQGNHWDVSDIEICVPEEQKEVTEDYDEIEYMPPRLVDLPYSPPFDFDLPDYKELGSKLLALAHSYPIDDPPSYLDDEYDGDFGASAAEWRLPLPQIDPVATSVRTKAAPTRIPTSRMTATRNGAGTSTRARTDTKSTSTANAVRRPNTSLSVNRAGQMGRKPAPLNRGGHPGTSRKVDNSDTIFKFHEGIVVEDFMFKV